MRELVANERGAHYVFMNIANLDPTNDDEFILTVAQEPFVYTDFWRKWHVLVYALLIALIVFVTGYFIDFYTLKRV